MSRKLHCMKASVFSFCGAANRIEPESPHCSGFLYDTQSDTRKDSSERVISASQRPLPTQHKTNTRDEEPCPQRDSNPRSQIIRQLQTYALNRAATGIGEGECRLEIITNDAEHEVTQVRTFQLQTKYYRCTWVSLFSLTIKPVPSFTGSFRRQRVWLLLLLLLFTLGLNPYGHEAPRLYRRALCAP
jgi:hypothetical protein